MKRLLLLFTALCATLCATAQNDLSKRIEEKRRAIAALEKQIADGERELSQIRKGKNSEQRSVDRLSRQIEQRRELLDQTAGQISLLAEELERTAAAADSLAGRLDADRRAYAEVVREAYRNYRQNNYVSYLFSAGSFTDAARRIANLRAVARLRGERIARIARTTEAVREQQALLNRRREGLDAERAKLDAQRLRYERDRNNARVRLQKMTARERSALKQQQQQQQRLDAVVAELRKLTKGNKEGASFSSRTSNLNLPVVGGRVKRYHDNIAEITGAQGAKIVSIYEGKVVDVKRNKVTNRYDVYVAHGEYITTYGSLNTVCVAKGQKVERNAELGTIGPWVDLETLTTEYRLVFGIYPPAGGKKMRAADCFTKK